MSCKNSSGPEELISMMRFDIQVLVDGVEFWLTTKKYEVRNTKYEVRSLNVQVRSDFYFVLRTSNFRLFTVFTISLAESPKRSMSSAGFPLPP